MNIKEVTVFMNGDSNKRKTWSNVPFFFCMALEERGIIVNRVNVFAAETIPNKFCAIAMQLYYKMICLFINRGTVYSYMRTSYYQRRVNKIINANIERFPHSDLFISISFSFNAANTKNIKTLMFSDWSISYYITKQVGREPDFFEKIAIKRQHAILNRADYVLALFPESKTFLENEIKRKVLYLGNVINAEKKVAENDFDRIIRAKFKSRKILFIGKGIYREGATELIKAINFLNETSEQFELHIVGMQKEELDCVNPGSRIKFYGYLDKDNPVDNDIYYDLIQGAALIVNTTPSWGGFSSICEAMYYLTPVVCGRYPEFIKTFGTSSSAVQFCDNEFNEIARRIKTINDLGFEEFRSTAVEAHMRVHDFTWTNFIERLLDQL